MAYLRNFTEINIDKDCSEVTGTHDNGLFFNCTFDDLRGLTLSNCDLNRSKFITKNLRDALGFTLTLDCNSFRDVEYSELLFDLFLCLATMTKGNDEKREKLKEVIGKEKWATLMRVLRCIE